MLRRSRVRGSHPNTVRVFVSLVVFVGLLGFVIAGCGSSATTTTAAGPTTGPTESTTTTAGGEPTLAVVVQGVDPTTMDPAEQEETTTWNVLRHLYDPLLERDTDDATKFHAVLSRRADSSRPNNSGVRRGAGVTFSGGEPFDAACVSGHNASTGCWASCPTLLPADSFMDIFQTLDGAEVVDAQTVRIITTAPDPVILARLTQLGMIPTARMATLMPWPSEPNGTGPYTLVK